MDRWWNGSRVVDFTFRYVMHPILYSKKLPKIIPEDFEEIVKQMWKDQKPYLKWTNQYNTKLEDEHNKLDPLWKEFCNIPEKIISPKTYYVYINDKNWHKTHWHDHSKNSINCGCLLFK